MELEQLTEQALADSIERYATEAYQRISEEAHYDFELTPEVFNRYLDIHLSAVTPLIKVAISTVRRDGVADPTLRRCLSRIMQERRGD